MNLVKFNFVEKGGVNREKGGPDVECLCQRQHFLLLLFYAELIKSQRQSHCSYSNCRSVYYYFFGLLVTNLY